MDFSLLQANTDNPSISTVVYTMLMAFLLSTLLAFTYEKSTRNIVVSKNYLQALVLASLVSATVMQAIGDSLARGLGMLGALAIIRFRTTLRHPRNMMFMFSSLAVGISCGVYGFNIAVIGTVTFCLVAFLLRFSPFSDVENLVGNLRFNMRLESSHSEEKVRKLVKPFCRKYAIQRMQISNKKTKVPEGETPEAYQIMEYELQVKLKDKVSPKEMIEQLNVVENVEQVRFSLKNASIEY